MEQHTSQIMIGGRPLTLETGKLARQANGAVLVRYGDTTILATATGSKEPREGIDFFPLTCDYEERLYAVGKIPGGFIKREGRPSEKAILSSRLIDRPIRPLFPKGYRNDVQVVATVMSVDQNNAPDITAMIGASAALTVSDIPFLGPIAAVIVGRINGQFIINPTLDQETSSDLHLVVAGTKDAVMMVEAGANEVPEDDILEAIMFGHDEIKKIIAFLEEFRAAALAKGLAKEKIEPALYAVPSEIDAAVREFATPKIVATIEKCINEKIDKKTREGLMDDVKKEVLTHFAETYPENTKSIAEIIGKIEKESVRKKVTVDRIRLDGRSLEEVRPIYTEVGVLPRTHGSGLFTRGQTQVLTATTLGALGDEQILDGLGVEDSKRYMHHYNFPPYSVGEARPLRGPGRRDIGHGALAERALEPMIPSEDDFPYTIRLVSEVLESNGSSSMGSVCGSTLSLMHAGVPIKAPVAGVAMGLVKEQEQVAILTDIQGAEDALGDMDFKVAGTEKGVTAIQMDIKIAGIDRSILKEALAQAYKGRMHILGKMLETIKEPNKELSQYAPRIIKYSIHPDKIRDVIGPGGKMIKKIIEETRSPEGQEVKIDIEDDGRVLIASVDAAAGEKALKMIKDLTADVEVGKIYNGKVVRLMAFGAFVEILPGKEGLVHISQIAEQRVEKVEDVLSAGDEILVKVTEIDKQGRINLSRKAALPKAEDQA